MQLRQEIEKRSFEKHLPCAVAFEIAADLNVTPLEVGEEANRSETRIAFCQLGLFGFDDYGKKRIVHRLERLPSPLANDLQQASTDGRIACAAAWKIADEPGLPRCMVGCAAETLDLRVTPCQLGCF